jgi:hypothetical protein
MNSASDKSGKRQERNRRLERDINELGESLSEYVREEPLTSVAIAGAAGFIIGGGAKSRIGLAALAMVGRIALRGAVTNLIVGLFIPDSGRKNPRRVKPRRRDRDERHDHARHDNGRANIRNPG